MTNSEFMTEDQLAELLHQVGWLPAGYAVLVKVKDEAVEKTTDSGIVIPDAAKKRMSEDAVFATILATGPMAWSDEKIARAKVGDVVMLTAYAGTRFMGEDGNHYRLVNSREVISVKIRS